MSLKHELQSIISGISNQAATDFIKAAANYLSESKKAGGNAQKSNFTKEQETEKLIKWITATDFWFTEFDENRFIARGAEQRVYLYTDERYVYKLNDSIFTNIGLTIFTASSFTIISFRKQLINSLDFTGSMIFYML